MKVSAKTPYNLHRSHNREILRKGSLVEVSSDEEGYRGAWFVATVLRPPLTSPKSSYSKKKSPIYRKAYVEYKSLVSDEDPSRPLREYVNAAFVRPVPPEETHPKPFKLGDAVDCYYLDGWWTGVITRLLPDSRFVVTFQNPPDEIEFGLSDMRFHREWVNGNWVLPINQKAAGVMFSVGKKVEISLDREGHQESWIPATILEETGNGIFSTEYQIQDRNGLVGHLNAEVDCHHIRPCPPHLNDKDFHLLEKVDAFCDGRWRSGVITKELADRRYIVFFKQSNNEKEFGHSELRPHMEWKDGKWFTSSQDVLVPPDYQNHEGRVCNSTNISEIAVSLGSSGGSIKNNPAEKSNTNLDTMECHVELSTPCNKESSGVVPDLTSDSVGKEKSAEDLSPVASPISTNITEGLSEEKNSKVLSPKSESVGNNFSKQLLGGDHSSDSHAWGRRIKRKQMKFGGQDCPVLSLKRKTTDSFTVMPIEEAQTSNEGKEGNADGGADVQKECMTKKTNLPIVLGLACDMMRSSKVRKRNQSTRQESSKHIEDSTGLDCIELQSVTVGEESQKRRRGRPPKSATKSSIVPMPAERDASTSVVELSESNTLQMVAVTDTSVSGQECVSNGSKKLLGSQMKRRNRPGIVSSSPLRMPNEDVAEVKQQERHSQRRVKRRMINLNSVSQVHDSSDATLRNQADSNSGRKGFEMVIKDNASDDQPLSTWFGEMHSPAYNDGARGVTPPRNVEQYVEASSEKLAIVVKETPAVDNENGAAGDEFRYLPFVKNTILWSTIESLEVFQRMPQKPHFRPLEQCKESSREGLAIGLMVTFSSVVESASRLQLDDPQSTMNDILETFVELQSHGFDVQAARDRVIALLSVKQKQENLQIQIEQLENEIGMQILEKTKIDQEIDEMTKKINDLQRKLSEAMSKKQNKDCEISSLQIKQEEIKEDINSLHRDFEGLGTLF